MTNVCIANFMFNLTVHLATTEQVISNIILSSSKFSTVVDDLSNSDGLKLIFDMSAMHARHVHPRLRIRFLLSKSNTISVFFLKLFIMQAIQNNQTDYHGTP